MPFAAEKKGLFNSNKLRMKQHEFRKKHNCNNQERWLQNSRNISQMANTNRRKYTTYGKRKVLFHSDLNFRVSIPLKPTQIFFFFFKLKGKRVPFVQGRLIFGKTLVPETARSSSRGVVSVG